MSNFDKLDLVGQGLGQFADVMEKGRQLREQEAPLTPAQRELASAFGREIDPTYGVRPGNRIGDGLSMGVTGPTDFAGNFKTQKDFGQLMQAAPTFMKNLSVADRLAIEAAKGNNALTVAKQKGTDAGARNSNTNMSRENAARIGANARMYGSDNQLEGTKYSADKRVDAARESAAARAQNSAKPDSSRVREASKQLAATRHELGALMVSPMATQPETQARMQELQKELLLRQQEYDLATREHSEATMRHEDAMQGAQNADSYGDDEGDGTDAGTPAVTPEQAKANTDELLGKKPKATFVPASAPAPKPTAATPGKNRLRKAFGL